MANTKHAVVRIDKLGGTLDGAQLESAIFYNDSDAAEIDNAQLVILGEKLGREVYKATAPTATSTVADLYLTAGVELFYDQTVAHYLPEWVNEAGRPVRVYSLNVSKGGFSATAEAFDGTPAKGKFVGFAAGSTKIKIQETADDKTFGCIDFVETVGFGDGRYTYYMITLK